MKQASVGFHCPECVSSGKQRVYTGTNLPGAQGLVTKALVGINVAVFVYAVVAFDATAFSDGTTAIEIATNGFAIDAQDEWWRIVTGGFGHFGVLHLAMNMYGLWRIGPILEQRLGPILFGLAYTTALLGGSFGALLLEPRALTMGASGAIFGLLGLLVMLFHQRGISLQQSGLRDVLMINLFISFSGFVSLGGHAGGFVVGLLLGALYFGVGPGAEPAFGRSKWQPLFMTVALGAALVASALWAASRWVVL
jgi:membrane associated rhomboid family serine protease